VKQNLTQATHIYTPYEKYTNSLVEVASTLATNFLQLVGHDLSIVNIDVKLKSLLKDKV